MIRNLQLVIVLLSLLGKNLHFLTKSTRLGGPVQCPISMWFEKFFVATTIFSFHDIEIRNLVGKMEILSYHMNRALVEETCFNSAIGFDKKEQR